MAMNIQTFNSPQLLTGNVAIGSGKTAVVPSDAMASRSNRWLRVDEMSVTLWANPNSSILSRFQYPLGKLVKIRARAYRQDMMLNYVPVWLIGPRLHQAAESESASYGVPPASNSNAISTYETYRWKFAKPFYLPPGSAMIAQIQRDGSVADIELNVNINVQVSFRACQVSENIAKDVLHKRGADGQLGNPIPYMAAYAPSAFPAKSNNRDLANNFLTPLYLQRMTGRCWGTSTNLGADTEDSNPGTASITATAVSTVKLTDTRLVICDVSKMASVFPSNQLAWTHKRMLQPGEYITAELNTTSADGSTPAVAIIGYRNGDLQ